MIDLERRIRRLEDYEELRQLVWRYALALDSRDVEAMAALFVDDVQLGDGRSGREALASAFSNTMETWGVMFHPTTNQTVDFDDDDHAYGVTFCRPEVEVGAEWIVMAMQYWDRYERRQEGWRFRSRKPMAFYAADILQRPQTLGGRFHFPGNDQIHVAELPEKLLDRRFTRHLVAGAS